MRLLITLLSTLVKPLIGKKKQLLKSKSGCLSYIKLSWQWLIYDCLNPSVLYEGSNSLKQLIYILLRSEYVRRRPLIN